EVTHSFGDFLCAANRARRTIEGGEEAVARGVVFHAAPPTERLTHDCVVAKDQLLPVVVTKLDLLLSRSDDVGEQDGRENGVQLRRSSLHADEAPDPVEDELSVDVN